MSKLVAEYHQSGDEELWYLHPIVRKHGAKQVGMAMEAEQWWPDVGELSNESTRLLPPSNRLEEFQNKKKKYSVVKAVIDTITVANTGKTLNMKDTSFSTNQESKVSSPQCSCYEETKQRTGMKLILPSTDTYRDL